MSIQYRVVPLSPEAHLYEVQLMLDCPDPSGQIFWLPTWIPGSYLMREFSRHIISITAQCGDGVLKLTKIDKMRWRTEPAEGSISLKYVVYANDLSVRGAYLDQSRGFFNGTSIFLAVQGQEGLPCEVEIAKPVGKMFKDWKVATSLSRGNAKAWEFGGYCAANYDELIDHPVELGEFTHIGFKACGVSHELVIAGRHNADLRRLKRDIKKICEAQIRFWGEPAPFNRYMFLTLAVGEGYGGLEHRSSTALICSRDDLPCAHEHGMKVGYRQFLGLVSHEYFHTWNVKRLKPAAFAPYALDREGYTRLLWAFEGITSYYDDLFLRRTGLISEQEYLDLLAQGMTSVQRTPGRHMQTLEDASLDAWIKYYRQDENSPNSLVSYYVKGALAALSLDLTIRDKTEGRKSLDDIMRALWQRFGKDFDVHGRGVPEHEWELVAEEVAGIHLSDFFAQALRSTDEMLLAEPLAKFGVDSQLRIAAAIGDKGGWMNELPKSVLTLSMRTTTDNGFLKITHVLNGGAAESAGLSAGDLLLALDELRISPTNFDALLAQRIAGKKRILHFFRRDELLCREITPQRTVADTWGLRLAEADPLISARRKSWLGE